MFGVNLFLRYPRKILVIPAQYCEFSSNSFDASTPSHIYIFLFSTGGRWWWEECVGRVLRSMYVQLYVQLPVSVNLL